MELKNVEIPSAEKRNPQNMCQVLVNDTREKQGHKSIIRIAYYYFILTVLASFRFSTLFGWEKIFDRRKALTIG